MKLQQFITTNPQSIGRGTTVSSAIRQMETGRFRHLLVKDGEQLVGLVSRRELNLVSMISAIDPDRSSVELAMTPDPFQVDVDTPLAEVAGMMANAKVGSAVVLKNGDTIGIFTTIDALRALEELAS